jgi:hypothetical protein
VDYKSIFDYFGISQIRFEIGGQTYGGNLDPREDSRFRKFSQYYAPQIKTKAFSAIRNISRCWKQNSGASARSSRHFLGSLANLLKAP